MRKLELTGDRFGKWSVLHEDPERSHGSVSWLCRCECGTVRSIRGTALLNGKTTQCRDCLIASRRNPTSRWINQQGYVVVPNHDHPNRWVTNRIYEHVLVLTKVLGRSLYPGETVHHINGVKDDNRPENLELWVTFQPSGQRPEDLVVWAREVLDRYAET